MYGAFITKYHYTFGRDEMGTQNGVTGHGAIMRGTLQNICFYIKFNTIIYFMIQSFDLINFIEFNFFEIYLRSCKTRLLFLKIQQLN